MAISKKRSRSSIERGARAGLFVLGARTGLRRMREHARRRGWQVIHEHVGTTHRASLRDLVQSASDHNLDIVVIASLAPWARSLPDLVRNLAELAERGARVVATEEALEVLPSDAALLTALTVFYRTSLAQRIKAGLARAKRRGKHLGPPRSVAQHHEQVQRCKAARLSQAETARQIGISRTSVRRMWNNKA